MKDKKQYVYVYVIDGKKDSGLFKSNSGHYEKVEFLGLRNSYNAHIDPYLVKDSNGYIYETDTIWKL
jgi:hypothetical protein